jgi:hypothetical protein
MEAAAARLTDSDSPILFEDGLGQRSRTADPAGGASLEVLALRPSFSTVPSFEFALRERAGRLSGFRHAYYARVRSVDRTTGADPQLRVVSEAGHGMRLSELLAGAQARRVPIDINAALCLIRQLVPAVAMLHESARDVAHGAIGPERLLVTPQARLLIVEYVLGAALEQLRYTRERYWTELRIPLPASGLGPRFDHRADVTQIGVVALSLILGRSLRQEEFADRLADVVASTWAVSPRGGFEPLPPGLRGWLGRALQLDASRSFPSAVAARAELDTVLGDSELVAAPASLEAFLTRYHSSEAPPVEVMTAASARGSVAAPPESRNAAASRGPASADRVPVMPARTPDLAASSGASGATVPAPRIVSGRADVGTSDDPFRVIDARLDAPRADSMPLGNSISRKAPTAGTDAGTHRYATAKGEETPQALPAVRDSAGFTPAPPMADFTAGLDAGIPVDETQASTDENGSWTGRFKDWRVIGAGVAVIAVIAAGSSIGARRPAAEQELHAASGTLEVSTAPAGVQAYVDGALRGVTPLVLALEPGAHMLELRGAGEPRTIPVTVNPGARVSQYVELSASGARLADGRGGAAPPAPASASASAGASAQAASSTTSGGAGTSKSPGSPPPAQWTEGGSQTDAPPAGTVTFATRIDVKVYEKGVLLGSGRDRLSLSPGRHQLDVVNADLGVQSTESVQVTAGKTTEVTLQVPNGSLSLNATPWAEVWLDGQRLGETPLGNLSVPIGSHDLVLRHPELGERHQVVVVTARQPVRLSVDLRGR